MRQCCCLIWKPANKGKPTSKELRPRYRQCCLAYLWMFESFDIYGWSRHPAAWQFSPKIIWENTAEPPLGAARCSTAVDALWRETERSTTIMTKFSYSDYLSQFRNAGRKCNVQLRLRGDSRRGDNLSDGTSEPEWVFVVTRRQHVLTVCVSSCLYECAIGSCAQLNSSVRSHKTKIKTFNLVYLSSSNSCDWLNSEKFI